MALTPSIFALLATLLQDPGNPSIVDFLRERHMPDKLVDRATLYAQLVDKDAKFTGSEGQNTRLLEALRALEGKTRRDLASVKKESPDSLTKDFPFVRWAPVQGVGVHASFAVRVEVGASYDAEKKTSALADKGIYVVITSAAAQLATFQASGTVKVEVNGDAKATPWKLQPAWFATIGPDDKAIRLYGEKDKQVEFRPDDRVVLRFEINPVLKTDAGPSPIWPGTCEVVLQEGKKAPAKEPAKQEEELLWMAAPQRWGGKQAVAAVQDGEPADLKTAREVAKANEEKTYGTFDCTVFVWAFVQELAKRDGVTLPVALEKLIKVRPEELEKLEGEEKRAALDPLVDKLDARIAGVQKGLVDNGLGEIVALADAQPGDIVQYWYREKDSKKHWGGHAAVIVAKKPAAKAKNRFVLTLLGSHRSVAQARAEAADEKAKEDTRKAPKEKSKAKDFSGIGDKTETLSTDDKRVFVVRWKSKAGK